jgi:hypothetical protein
VLLLTTKKVAFSKRKVVSPHEVMDAAVTATKKAKLMSRKGGTPPEECIRHDVDAALFHLRRAQKELNRL